MRMATTLAAAAILEAWRAKGNISIEDSSAWA